MIKIKTLIIIPILSLLLCSMSISVYAQTGTWTPYNTANSGLPSGYVRAIAQENDSVMWIGTLLGLARFDGINWTVYNTGNSGIPANEVRAIIIDGHQKWIGTLGGGVAMFNDTNWTVYNSSNSPLPSNNILCLEFDCANNLWIGATAGGATHYDRINNVWTSYTTSNSGISANNIRSIYARDSADIWFGTIGGLSHFQSSSWTVYLSSNSPLPYDDVRDVKEDVAGNLWIGTYGGGPIGGMAKFDGANWTVYDTSNSSMLSNSVGTILIDPCGDVWCGNYYINKFDGVNWTMYDTVSSPLTDYNVALIIEDCEGDIWVGTINAGIVRFHNDCAAMPDCSTQPLCAVILNTSSQTEIPISVHAFPNPVGSMLSLEIKGSEGPAELTIYSLSGQIVWKGKSSESFLSIDISGLEAGSYILEVVQEAETARISFSKY